MLLLNIVSIALVMVILVIIILYLISINRKLNQRIQQEKNRFLLYTNKLKELHSKTSLGRRDLDILSNLAKDFFKERFNINYNKSYNELVKIFEEESLDERVDFCETMSNILYAGEKIDSQGIRRLVELLQEIIEKYRYM